MVNVQDLVLVAADFGKIGEYKTDINGDGTVNIQDLIVVVVAFMVEYGINYTVNNGAIRKSHLPAWEYH